MSRHAMSNQNISLHGMAYPALPLQYALDLLRKIEMLNRPISLWLKSLSSSAREKTFEGLEVGQR